MEISFNSIQFLTKLVIFSVYMFLVKPNDALLKFFVESLFFEWPFMNVLSFYHCE